MMGRKVLLAAFCCITLTKTWTDATKAPINSENGVGQATVQRLYRNIPVGVYASASPYAAFSFQIPKLASAPRFTQVGPVKQDSVVANTQALLKDSYGNKFVDAPQKLAYRTTFPQQYVQLQELPAHLAQPLVSAAPTFQYKQVTPHFFGPPQFKVQSLHAALPNTATRYAVNQLHAYPGSGIRSLAPLPQHAVSQQAPSQQHQHSTNNQVIYADTHAAEQFQNFKNVANLHLEEIPNHHKAIGPAPAVTQANKAQLKTAASTATASKGKKPIFNLVTKPAVPLLDLSLLEPLTFANPLVPQVQHFLPRINSVKYHKLPEVNVNEIKKEKKEMQFIIQNTKSYDSGLIKNKPKINLPKKTQPNPQSENEDTYHEQAPLSPNESPTDVSNEEPEINSYEINSPNYKETYKEMVVSYNKETQSEPAHYNYEKKVEKEPVHYHFVHTSKEPLQVKNVHFENNGQNPKQLVYNLQSNENNDKKSDNQTPQKNESDGSSEESDEDEVPPHDEQQNKGEPFNKPQLHHHENPEHREEIYYHNPDKLIQHIVYSESPQDYSQVKNIPLENVHFQPIITEYEENIRILPIPKQYAAIKVNPGQHIQHGQVPLKQNAGNQHNQPHDSLRNYHESHKRPHHQPEQHVHEKTKHVVTKEETPEEENSNNEQDEEVEHDEKSEQDFEKGYKNAAFGFPAYESRDTEKEIYNPDTYGEPQYHTDYDIENSPFKQYQLEGDEFPKSTRSNYKDARDKTKEDYYSDYSVSKPESMAARYRQKEDYFKMFEKRKPHYLSDERENDEKKESAKYTAAPAFDYYGSAHKPKQYATQYKEAHQPQRFEYDYSKDTPKDSSGHASRPLQRLKTHTQFVEPQFQYGFEPSALPRLLDSELAAMASNNSPESKKPNSRKKLYKENWYIKKMSTDGRRAAS